MNMIIIYCIPKTLQITVIFLLMTNVMRKHPCSLFLLGLFNDDVPSAQVTERLISK